LDEVNEEPKMAVPPSQVQPPINPESGDKKPTYADITKSKCRTTSEQNSPDSNGTTSCCSDSSLEDNKTPDVAAVTSTDDVTLVSDVIKPVVSGHGGILMENSVELVEVEKALQKTAIVSPIATKSPPTSSDVASSDKVVSMATSSEKQTNKMVSNNPNEKQQSAKNDVSGNISNGHNRRDNYENRRFSNKNNHHDHRGNYDNDGNHRNHGNRGYARSNRGRGNGGLRNNPRKSNRSNFNNQLTTTTTNDQSPSNTAPSAAPAASITGR